MIIGKNFNAPNNQIGYGLNASRAQKAAATVAKSAVNNAKRGTGTNKTATTVAKSMKKGADAKKEQSLLQMILGNLIQDTPVNPKYPTVESQKAAWRQWGKDMREGKIDPNISVISY